MFKPSGNPKVEELTKSCRERRVNLSNLKVIKVDHLRYCVWCAVGKLSHGNQKYCSQECSSSAMAWANPQKEEALTFLLMRQDYKCNVCKHDWAPLAQEVWARMHANRYDAAHWATVDFKTQFNWGFTRRIKSNCPQEHALEVDHIVPIYKGGTALGLDNHQAICYTCHKAKSKVDNSGPRPKKNLEFK